MDYGAEFVAVDEHAPVAIRSELARDHLYGQADFHVLHAQVGELSRHEGAFL